MDDIFIDRILDERKIISANGNIEIDRISNFDDEHPDPIKPNKKIYEQSADCNLN